MATIEILYRQGEISVTFVRLQPQQIDERVRSYRLEIEGPLATGFNEDQIVQILFTLYYRDDPEVKKLTKNWSDFLFYLSSNNKLVGGALLTIGHNYFTIKLTNTMVIPELDMHVSEALRKFITSLIEANEIQAEKIKE